MRISILKTIGQKYFPYLDLACIFLAFGISYLILPYLVILFSPYSEGPVPPIKAFAWILIVVSPIWIILNKIEGVYKKLIKFSYFTILGKMAKIIILGFAFSTLIMFLLKEIGMSRLFITTLSVFSFCLMTFSRLIFRLLMNRARKSGYFTEQVLLIGNGSSVEKFVKKSLPKEQERTLEVLGYVSISSEYNVTNLPQLGYLKDLKNIINNNPVDQVIWIVSKNNIDRFSNIFKICEDTGTTLRLLDEYILSKGVGTTFAWRNDFFAGFPSVYFAEVNWSADKEILKRTFDLFFSSLALLILLPFMGLIATMIKLSSKGPVFYRRRVIGQHGKQFVALKFRSMVENAHEILQKDKNLLDEYQKSLKIKKDTRVTKIGNILRKISLDELPQFINVFKGEMSIVGPRMLGDIEWNKYGEAKAKVLSVKPGITGLWQVSGRHKVTFEERIQYDIFYINNWNISMDLWLILKTIPVLLKIQGEN